MYRLDTEVINNLKEIFSEFKQISSVILYGSRAKGNYRKGSDIDLTLLGEGLTLSIVYKIKNKIEDLNLPYEFDISIQKNIDNQKLKDHINRVGKIFYQKKTVLPKGWEIKKLGEVCEIKPPKKIAKEKLTESDLVTFFPMEDLKEFNHYIKPIKTKYFKDVYGGYVYFENNDVLLAKITPCFENGKLGIAKDLKNGIGFGSSEYIVFRPKVEILSEYIYYFLSLENIRRNGKNRMTGAVGHKRIPVDYFSNQNLIIPPLPEQKRIVTILNKAFAAIAKTKANAEQNLKNAKELFESYLQGVFENKGEGWEEKRFDEICVLQRGFDLPTRLRSKGGFPMVSSNGITDRIDQWKVKAPGVATGRSGTIGNVHFIEEDYWPLNTALYIKEFHGNYERCIYYFLRQFDLSKYSSGSGVPTLNRNNVHGEMVLFPKSLKIQQTIVKKLDALSAETKKMEAIYQQKIEDLEELKKSILQKAFNGEL